MHRRRTRFFFVARTVLILRFTPQTASATAPTTIAATVLFSPSCATTASLVAETNVRKSSSKNK
jgi:hypothetical protein